MAAPRYDVVEAKIDDIFVVGNRRPLDRGAVVRLTESIKNIGLQTPITVRLTDVLDPEEGEYTRAYALIAGHHRLEAYKVLGLDRIPVIIRNCDEIEAQLWEIAENLHRAELTALERDEQVAKWVKLNAERVSSQVDTKPQGGRPESGVNAAARELGLEKMDAHRAVKVASLSDEAKEAARDAGLDDTRSVLLTASKETDPAKQIEVIQTAAAAKSTRTRAAKTVLTDDELAKKQSDDLFEKWQGLSELARQKFIERIRLEQSKNEQCWSKETDWYVGH